jgi:hypothetical protein
MEWKHLENTVQTQHLRAVTDAARSATDLQIADVQVAMNPVTPVDVWHANVKVPALYEILNAPMLHLDRSELSHAWRLVDVVASLSGEDVMNAEELPDTMELQAVTGKTRLRL